MADLHLVLRVEPAMLRALERLAVETGTGSPCLAAKWVLREWLVATGYLDEDKPFAFRPEPEDDCG